jgi:KDO2-lipid IV(A) lauroyltransferase
VSIDPLRLLPAATRVLGRVPATVVDSLAGLAGTAIGAWPSPRNRRVAAHTGRLRPDLSPGRLRPAVRANLRGYLRYFAEAIQLGASSPDQIRARVRTVGRHHVQPTFDSGRPVVAALLHAGNWDLAGAWSCLEMAPVLTVAERLHPDELHEQFVSLREEVGMTIVVADEGRPVLRELVEIAPTRPHLVPLLADRDLGHTGVEVTLAGHTMLVGAGPAALALQIGAPLELIGIRHERLDGARARAAGTRSGIVIEFSSPLDGTEDVRRPVGSHTRADVVDLTRAWVAEAEPFLRRYPEQWHMLQPVFTDDLDPVRLAAGRARAMEREARGRDGTPGPAPA